jgi:tRNA-dihydrouridine synthase A
MSAFSPFSVAPMMDWTDRHCRYFHRLLSRHARLYTEMVTTGALLYGDKARHLDYSRQEHPIALQLGGSDPKALAQCAQMGEDWGYDEVNLNCGCPSDRVQNGRFGACLMAEPALVAQGVAAMKAVTHLPITVKCRIGIDDQDSEEGLNHFAQAVIEAGADALIIHARKAWLKGLSPKENRDIPPLDYGRVFRLKARFPHCPMILNGGITTLEQGQSLMQQGALEGIMLGRSAYQDPFILLGVDPLFHKAPPL